MKFRKLKVLKNVEDKADFEFPEANPLVDKNIPSDDAFPRNYSATQLVQKLGSRNFKTPKILKSRKIHPTNDIVQEILEKSYEILEEDEDVPESPFGFNQLFDKQDSIKSELSPEQVADLYYVGFSPEEKLELVEKKIQMLEERMKAEEAKGDSTDPLTQQLLDLLSAAKAARLENVKDQ